MTLGSTIIDPITGSIILIPIKIFQKDQEGKTWTYCLSVFQGAYEAGEYNANNLICNPLTKPEIVGYCIDTGLYKNLSDWCKRNNLLEQWNKAREDAYLPSIWAIREAASKNKPMMQLFQGYEIYLPDWKRSSANIACYPPPNDFVDINGSVDAIFMFLLRELIQKKEQFYKDQNLRNGIKYLTYELNRSPHYQYYRFNTEEEVLNFVAMHKGKIREQQATSYGCFDGLRFFLTELEADNERLGVFFNQLERIIQTFSDKSYAPRERAIEVSLNTFFKENKASLRHELQLSAHQLNKKLRKNTNEQGSQRLFSHMHGRSDSNDSNSAPENQNTGNTENTESEERSHESNNQQTFGGLRRGFFL